MRTGIAAASLLLLALMGCGPGLLNQPPQAVFIDGEAVEIRWTRLQRGQHNDEDNDFFLNLDADIEPRGSIRLKVGHYKQPGQYVLDEMPGMGCGGLPHRTATYDPDADIDEFFGTCGAGSQVFVTVRKFDLVAGLVEADFEGTLQRLEWASCRCDPDAPSVTLEGSLTFEEAR